MLYQAWCFSSPRSVCPRKRLALPLVVGNTVLFRRAFCYFFVFGTVFRSSPNSHPNIVPAPDIRQYLAFVMSMFLAFGILSRVPPPPPPPVLVDWGSSMWLAQGGAALRGHSAPSSSPRWSRRRAVMSQLMLAVPVLPCSTSWDVPWSRFVPRHGPMRSAKRTEGVSP